MTGQKCRQKPKYPCCVRPRGAWEPFSFQQNYFPSLPRAAEDFQLRHVIIPFPSPLFRSLAFRWGRESAKFSFQALTSCHPPLTHTRSLTCVGPLAKKGWFRGGIPRMPAPRAWGYRKVAGARENENEVSPLFLVKVWHALLTHATCHLWECAFSEEQFLHRVPERIPSALSVIFIYP